MNRSLFTVLLVPFAALQFASAEPRPDAPIDLSPSTRTLNQRALTVWSSASFQEEFARSYLAVSDVEPPINPDELEAMQEILSLLSANDLAGAEASLIRQRTERSSAVVDFHLANIYLQTERYDEAAAVYQVAIGKHSRFLRAYKNLGVAQMRRSEWKGAAEALTQVIALGGADKQTYGLLGFAYNSLGNSLSAESAFRMAILMDPESLEWKMYLAQTFLQQNRYSDAAALLEQLIEKYPDNTLLWLQQANAFIGLEQPMRAAANFELIDHMGQSTVETLNMLGDIYVNEGLYDIAVRSYIRAMELRPEVGPGRAVRAARVMLANAANEDTTQLLDEIELMHGTAMDAAGPKELLKLRAIIATNTGATDDEVRILKEVIELDPLDGEAMIALGQYYRGIGELETAVFHFERAAAMETHERMAKLYHAQLLASERKFAEALPLLRRVQQIRHDERVQQYLNSVEDAMRGR